MKHCKEDSLVFALQGPVDTSFPVSSFPWIVDLSLPISDDVSENVWVKDDDDDEIE